MNAKDEIESMSNLKYTLEVYEKLFDDNQKRITYLRERNERMLKEITAKNNKNKELTQERDQLVRENFMLKQSLEASRSFAETLHASCKKAIMERIEAENTIMALQGERADLISTSMDEQKRKDSLCRMYMYALHVSHENRLMLHHTFERESVQLRMERDALFQGPQSTLNNHMSRMQAVLNELAARK